MKISYSKQAVKDIIGTYLDTMGEDELAKLFNSLQRDQIGPWLHGFESVAQYLKEFPGFDLGEANIPEYLEDVSWHNDACPSWAIPGTQFKVWVDYALPKDRETMADYRYIITKEMPDGELIVLLKSDDWGGVCFCLMQLEIIEDNAVSSVVASVVNPDNRVFYTTREKVLSSATPNKAWEHVSGKLPEGHVLIGLEILTKVNV